MQRLYGGLALVLLRLQSLCLLLSRCLLLLCPSIDMLKRKTHKVRVHAPVGIVGVLWVVAVGRLLLLVIVVVIRRRLLLLLRVGIG